MIERPSGFSEELARKATRVYYEAQRRSRLGLFETLTKNNAETIDKLLEEKAMFARTKENAPRVILLADEIANDLPEAFFQNPSAWIEAQPSFKPPKATTPDDEQLTGKIKDILWYGHDADVDRIKKIEIQTPTGNRTIVSKRINPKWEDWHEVATARCALEAGIPTPRVLGEITDHGNLYAWFEYIPSIDLTELQQITASSPYSTIEQITAAADRFLTDGDRNRFDQYLSEYRALEKISSDFWEIGETILKQLSISPKSFLQNAEKPMNFLTRIHRQIKSAIPHTDKLQAYMDANGIRTTDDVAWVLTNVFVGDYVRSDQWKSYVNPPSSPLMYLPNPTRAQARKTAQLERQRYLAAKRRYAGDKASRAYQKSIPNLETANDSVYDQMRKLTVAMQELVQHALFGDKKSPYFDRWAPEAERLRKQYEDLGFKGELDKDLEDRNVLVEGYPVY